MGTWGNKLFDDDVACDVRDEFIRLLTEGKSGPEATDFMLGRWKETLADTDEGPVFWLALASTQHKYGRLESRVKDKAMTVLDQQLGLDRWREIGAHAVRGRVNQLQKVRDQLQSPQPKEKRIPPPFKDVSAWEVGEVISYQLKSGNLALFGVLGTESHANGISPVCELLDWSGSQPPLANEASTLAIRRGSVPPEVLLTAMASTDPQYASNPLQARMSLLADLGLIEEPPDDGAFEFVEIGAMTMAIHRLKSGDPELSAKLNDFVRQRSPKLLNPVTQFSIRRENKKSELPAKRVKRMAMRRSAIQALGDWMVFRWYELDDALADVFGVS
jgi:hypothetical protein